MQQPNGDPASGVDSGGLVIDDAFIKAWPNGGQAQLTPTFLHLQQQYITQSTQPALSSTLSPFSALLHSLLSSVLPPSPAAWVGVVAVFLGEVLNRSTRASEDAFGSVAQTAVVDGLWLLCQCTQHDEARPIYPRAVWCGG